MTIPLPAPTSQCFDNTRISAYKECPRKYFLRHVMHWNSEGTANALVFGLSWHDGMDIVWTHAHKHKIDDLAQMAQLSFLKTWEAWGLDPNPDLATMDRMAPRNPSVAHEMYYNYIDQRWNMLQRSELLSAEQPFAVPMPGLTDVWYIGRLDKAIQYEHQKLILEHKTTTAYATVGNFRSDYVDSWYSSSQVKGYQFGGGLYYPGLDAVWVDAALVHKKIHDAFKFIPVSHKFNLLEEWIGDTKGWIYRIITDTDAYNAAGELRGGVFPKNEDSCYGKYGTCPFLNICRAVADPTKLDNVPAGYVKEVWEPFSVLGLDKIVQQTKE